MLSAREAVVALRDAAGDGRIDALCDRFGVKTLGVFGSAARVDSDEPNDVDVAVSFLDVNHAVALLDGLVALTGYDGIDLAVIDRANPVLRGEAYDGIPLYEHASGAYAEAEMAAFAEPRDTAWLRALDLETMTR